MSFFVVCLSTVPLIRIIYHLFHVTVLGISHYWFIEVDFNLLHTIATIALIVGCLESLFLVILIALSPHWVKELKVRF